MSNFVPRTSHLSPYLVHCTWYLIVLSTRYKVEIRGTKYQKWVGNTMEIR